MSPPTTRVIRARTDRGRVGEIGKFLDLPRLGLEFNRRDYGRLRQLIAVLNSF